jgi:hypothetical protein
MKPERIRRIAKSSFSVIMKRDPIHSENTASESARNLLSRETVESLQELGNLLRQIHTRLLSEGYVIKNGEVLKPDPGNPHNGGNNH